MGQGEARPGEKGLGLRQRQLQGQGESHGGGLGGLVVGIGADLREELAADVGPLVALYVRHALFVDEAKQGPGKALVQPLQHGLQVRGDIRGGDHPLLIIDLHSGEDLRLRDIGGQNGRERKKFVRESLDGVIADQFGND